VTKSTEHEACAAGMSRWVAMATVWLALVLNHGHIRFRHQAYWAMNRATLVMGVSTPVAALAVDSPRWTVVSGPLGWPPLLFLAGLFGVPLWWQSLRDSLGARAGKDSARRLRAAGP